MKIFKKRKARYRLFVNGGVVYCIPLNIEAHWQRIWWVIQSMATDSYIKGINFDR